MIPAALVALALLLSACGSPAQEADTLVVSSDPALRSEVAELLPELARRSGIELRAPVRVERRTREELEGFLVARLEEDLPPDRAERITRAYALLGMVPQELDLRALLLAVYLEQVAGFYDPDSTTLFVLEDQPAESLVPLLVHELVHAVQDQAADLESLTHRSRGNDRRTAAQAAIEGHATLVMLEYMTSRVQGGTLDLGAIPDFAARVRPVLEAARDQYPALAGAPRIIQESILFPYVEGALLVHALWAAVPDGGARPPPFGEHLPESTEQVLHPERFVEARDAPVEVAVEVPGTRRVADDVLGEMETRVFLQELAGRDAGVAAAGWDGDRWVLVGAGAGTGLAWAAVWDDGAARDRFLGTLRPGLERLPRPATLEAIEIGGRPGVLLRVGEVGGVEVGLAPEGGG